MMVSAKRGISTLYHNKDIAACNRREFTIRAKRMCGTAETVEASVRRPIEVLTLKHVASHKHSCPRLYAQCDEWQARGRTWNLNFNCHNQVLARRSQFQAIPFKFQRSVGYFSCHQTCNEMFFPNSQSFVPNVLNIIRL